jgi:hypothetical protein
MLSHNLIPLVPSMMLGELKQLKYVALHGNPIVHYAQERLLDANAMLLHMRALNSTSGSFSFDSIDDS